MLMCWRLQLTIVHSNRTITIMLETLVTKKKSFLTFDQKLHKIQFFIQNNANVVYVHEFLLSHVIAFNLNLETTFIVINVHVDVLL